MQHEGCFLSNSLILHSFLLVCLPFSERRRLMPYHKSTENYEEIGPEGGAITDDNTTVDIPPGALLTPTRITISKPNMKHLHAILSSNGWDKLVQLPAAIRIQCNPAIERFVTPVRIRAKLPQQEPGPSITRLLKSSYFRQWQDITDDPSSAVELLRDEVQITTDQVSWLAVTTVNLNPAKVAQMAMSSLTAEPVTLQLSAHGRPFSDSVIEVVIFATPCENGEPIHQNFVDLYSPISFPLTIQVWPRERVRLKLKGRFVPDSSSGEEDLDHEFVVQQSYNEICKKWVKLNSGQSLAGKLFISVCRGAAGTWEDLTNVNLSSKTSFAGGTATTLTS